MIPSVYSEEYLAGIFGPFPPDRTGSVSQVLVVHSVKDGEAGKQQPENEWEP